MTSVSETEPDRSLFLDPSDTNLPSQETNVRTQEALSVAGLSAFSKRRGALALVVIVAALSFLVVRGLGNATLYFLNADEAQAQAKSLGIKRFRLQGIVVEGSVKESPNTIDFNVEFNNTTIRVKHVGSPPELFRPNIAVVLEGAFESAFNGTTLPAFASDRILVKHDENYIQKNKARLKNAVDAPS
jgi:cytochrome c-type biogenesis protein CcmE